MKLKKNDEKKEEMQKKKKKPTSFTFRVNSRGGANTSSLLK